MSLQDEFDAVRNEGLAAIAEAADLDALEHVRIAYMGRNGRLKDLGQAFKEAASEEKRTLGKALNETNNTIKDAFNARKEELSTQVDTESIDITEPRVPVRRGSIHPISQVAQEVEAVFTSMGFDIVDGPHIESEEFNFTRLNIPADHPARDAQDTFWLSNGSLLRTHTSSVQSRTYPSLADTIGEAPIRKVVVGKVFRYEEVDSTHDNTFSQVEGFMVDKNITVAHLVGTLKTMISAVLKRDDVEVRLRPSFFPFVEPGFEVDVRAPGAEGRFKNWVELLGCGMIHPEVLRKGGIDPDIYQGFAFGLGLERLTMIRHNINDIRLFNGADLRGLQQFGA